MIITFMDGIGAVRPEWMSDYSFAAEVIIPPKKYELVEVAVIPADGNESGSGGNAPLARMGARAAKQRRPDRSIKQRAYSPLPSE
jgi:hypothetical protein